METKICKNELLKSQGLGLRPFHPGLPPAGPLAGQPRLCAYAPMLTVCAWVSGWRLRLPRTQWGPRRWALTPALPGAHPRPGARPGLRCKPMGASHAPPGAWIWCSARRRRALSPTALRTCGAAPGPARRRVMAAPAAGEVVIIGR